MKKSAKKMTFKEWSGFAKSIIAGVFGGFVTLAWSLTYEIVKDKSLAWMILAPTIIAVLLFLFLILFLQYLLLDRK